MPAPWYFGARGGGQYDSKQNGQYGGFNLGGVQTPFSGRNSVSEPQSASGAAGVAGTPPGQPVAEPQQGSTPAASTPSSNSGITGPNADLGSMGMAVGTLGVPGLGAVTGPLGGMAAGPIGGLVGGLAGSLAQGEATGRAANAIPNGLVDTQGNPVSFIGNQGYGGSRGMPGVIGNLLGSLGVPGFTNPSFYGDFNNPEQGYDINNVARMPDVAPNQGSMPGFSSGMADIGISPGSTFSSNFATGAGTGNASHGTTNFGGRGLADPANPDAPTQGAVVGGDPTGNTAGPSPTQGDPTGQEGGPGAPGAPSGDAPGDAGGGVSGAFRKGGRVQRPSPKALAEKLKAGSKVQTGSKKPGADDVPVRLSRGEEVVNKNATDKFGPVLDRMNAMGNRQGGMSVGRR